VSDDYSPALYIDMCKNEHAEIIKSWQIWKDLTVVGCIMFSPHFPFILHDVIFIMFNLHSLLWITDIDRDIFDSSLCNIREVEREIKNR
jgi:hypothetical protein